MKISTTNKILVLFLLLLLASCNGRYEHGPPNGGSSSSEFVSNGERIYFTGSNASGSAINAIGGNGHMNMHMRMHGTGCVTWCRSGRRKTLAAILGQGPGADLRGPVRKPRTRSRVRWSRRSRQLRSPNVAPRHHSGYRPGRRATRLRHASLGDEPIRFERSHRLPGAIPRSRLKVRVPGSISGNTLQNRVSSSNHASSPLPGVIQHDT